jgi:hypothetical protein
MRRLPNGRRGGGQDRAYTSSGRVKERPAAEGDPLQLYWGLLVFGNVLVGELHPGVTEELLHPFAEQSAGPYEQNNGMLHHP